MDTTITTVFVAALITALATGLGALPVRWLHERSRRVGSLGNAVAAGLMLAASMALIDEGLEVGVTRVLLGLLGGLALVVVGERVISSYGDTNEMMIANPGMMKMVLIVGVMTVHSAAEGIAVGVSWAGGDDLGSYITLAIAVHNIPEGLAIGLVLIPRGVSTVKAAGWSVFSSLPQPLLAVPAFLFVVAFEPWMPFGLGIAAGAMIWMVFAELVPDALEHASQHSVATAVTVSMTGMLLLQYLLQ